MKIRVIDPAITTEIASSTPEQITISSSSGSPPEPNTDQNLTDVSISDDNNAEYAEGGFVVHLQPLEEFLNEEEANPEKASEMTTPCNLPSTSAEPGDRSSVIIGQRLAQSKHTRIYNDATIQHLTRVLFLTDEPDNDDIQNASSFNVEDKIEKSNDTDNLEQGDRSSIIIGQRLAQRKPTRVYNDANIQHLTRVLILTDEPDNDDVQNASSLDEEDKIEEPNDTDNFTNNPSPVGKQNQTE